MVFIVCYPGGDLCKVSVAQCFAYEVSDFVLASEKIWLVEEENWYMNRMEAIRYTKELALKHNKEYVPFDTEDRSTCYILDKEEE